jgi:hypothetical protein
MAYIRTEEVAAIRAELKEAFGKKWRFGVRREAGGLAVAVTIKQGTESFEDQFKHGKGYAQVNQYWIDDHFQDAGEREQIKKLFNIIKTAPAKAPNGREWFDESDAMTDYFHTAFYMHVNIGSWDKPYKCVEG